MMKKKIRVSKEQSSASTSYFPFGEETRAKFKYLSLMQDYQELLKETKEKEKRLEKILHEKSKLLAQVKFLRQKFQQFSNSQTTQFKLKKQSHRFTSPSACRSQPKKPETELPMKGSRKEIPIPTTPLIDLNQ